jgi:hypothetical protein
VTKKYIGINADEIGNSLEGFHLGFWSSRRLV